VAGRRTPGHGRSVPCAGRGIYGQQALSALGLWEAVNDKLAPTKDVRASLTLVERADHLVVLENGRVAISGAVGSLLTIE
jgi:ABC-type molybdate transport system substrate-binding protein